ncbi:Tetratricopeptide repeat protein 39B [Kappamyces sp. JEL0829]|nr:Tetratricopeptide repeat protein 39B [Kappamyces sp. JEL0829]
MADSQHDDDLQSSLDLSEIKLNKQDLKLMKENGLCNWDQDLVQVMEAIDLFVDSKVADSEKKLRGKFGKTLLHTHGTAVLAMLKALMTFDKLDIAYAMECMKSTAEAVSVLRKEQSFVASFSGLFGGGQKSKIATMMSMTKLERHAEVTHAECFLLKAVLSVLTDSNMVTFMKEGLAIRQSYATYKTCYKFLTKIVHDEGLEGLVKHGIDATFVSAVYLGIGGFNLMLSILPQRVLRIFEFIGFSGQREFGMKCLALGGNWPPDELASPVAGAKLDKKLKQKVAVNFFAGDIKVEPGCGTRKFICEVMLQLYHVIISSMIQLPSCNVPLATRMIDRNIASHPDSFLFLIVRAKISQSERALERAITELNRIVNVQKDWRQLHHVCFWELGISHAALGEYEKAAGYFDILYKENEWSKAIYLYLKAVLLYEADPVKHKEEVNDCMNKVPGHLKKVAGKSVPLEKFVARKARKYFLQGERLLLPVLEIIYMWNGFDLIPEKRLMALVEQFDTTLTDLDKQQEAGKAQGNEIPYSSFYDDLCLMRFFKGLATRELAVPNAALLIPEKDLLARKLTKDQEKGLEYAARQLEFISLQADDIEYDHWILPFTRYELAALYLRYGNYDKARSEYQAALNGGYAEDEAGKQKKKASMETSLHIRVHNALAKLNFLQALKGEVFVQDEGDEQAEQDSDEE